MPNETYIRAAELGAVRRLIAERIVGRIGGLAQISDLQGMPDAAYAGPVEIRTGGLDSYTIRPFAPANEVGSTYSSGTSRSGSVLPSHVLNGDTSRMVISSVDGFTTTQINHATRLLDNLGVRFTRGEQSRWDDGRRLNPGSMIVQTDDMLKALDINPAEVEAAKLAARERAAMPPKPLSERVSVRNGETYSGYAEGNGRQARFIVHADDVDTFMKGLDKTMSDVHFAHPKYDVYPFEVNGKKFVGIAVEPIGHIIPHGTVSDIVPDGVKGDWVKNNAGYSSRAINGVPFVDHAYGFPPSSSEIDPFLKAHPKPASASLFGGASKGSTLLEPAAPKPAPAVADSAAPAPAPVNAYHGQYGTNFTETIADAARMASISNQPYHVIHGGKMAVVPPLASLEQTHAIAEAYWDKGSTLWQPATPEVLAAAKNPVYQPMAGTTRSEAVLDAAQIAQIRQQPVAMTHSSGTITVPADAIGDPVIMKSLGYEAPPATARTKASPVTRAAVSGGAMAAGLPAAMSGALAARKGADASAIAVATAQGLAEGLVPGSTTGFDGITNPNESGWDRAFNAASTATGATFTAGAVSTATGVGAVVGFPAMVVGGGANVLTNLARDATYLAGVTKHGGLITGLVQFAGEMYDPTKADVNPADAPRHGLSTQTPDANKPRQK